MKISNSLIVSGFLIASVFFSANPKPLGGNLPKTPPAEAQPAEPPNFLYSVLCSDPGFVDELIKHIGPTGMGVLGTIQKTPMIGKIVPQWIQPYTDQGHLQGYHKTLSAMRGQISQIEASAFRTKPAPQKLPISLMSCKNLAAQAQPHCIRTIHDKKEAVLSLPGNWIVFICKTAEDIQALTQNLPLANHLQATFKPKQKKMALERTMVPPLAPLGFACHCITMCEPGVMPALYFGSKESLFLQLASFLCPQELCSPSCTVETTAGAIINFITHNSVQLQAMTRVNIKAILAQHSNPVACLEALIRAE